MAPGAAQHDAAHRRLTLEPAKRLDQAVDQGIVIGIVDRRAVERDCGHPARVDVEQHGLVVGHQASLFFEAFGHPP
jgi:hypothetical protein